MFSILNWTCNETSANVATVVKNKENEHLIFDTYEKAKGHTKKLKGHSKIIGELEE